jgi:hypothetical protein
MSYKDANRDIGVLNLENCRRKEIVSKIWSNLPCPAWIVPNLTKMNLSFAKKVLFVPCTEIMQFSILLSFT